jgi:hypothetical protein
MPSAGAVYRRNFDAVPTNSCVEGGCMKVIVGKPFLALMSAACIAVPAATPDVSAA